MPLKFDPPLLNSSSPWATTSADLRALYTCLWTGAITIRTSLLSKGFPHNDDIHQYTFFNSNIPSGASAQGGAGKIYAAGEQPCDPAAKSSLNTLGYSPIPLEEYLEIIRTDLLPLMKVGPPKPVIISVTGTATEVAACYQLISGFSHDYSIPRSLLLEINLSCPNIPDKPPPAYDARSLGEYLRAVEQAKRDGARPPLEVGIKMPPYTYQGQFAELVDALLKSCSGQACPIDFITATNTLGSCLLLSGGRYEGSDTLGSAAGTGIGGMAGTALHPLALGNVRTLRTMLDAHRELQEVEIIGIGGVEDAAGFKRMIKVGASAIGIGTAFGREGLSVFQKILKEL